MTVVVDCKLISTERTVGRCFTGTNFNYFINLPSKQNQPAGSYAAQIPFPVAGPIGHEQKGAYRILVQRFTSERCQPADTNQRISISLSTTTESRFPTFKEIYRHRIESQGPPFSDLSCSKLRTHITDITAGHGTHFCSVELFVFWTRRTTGELCGCRDAEELVLSGI